MNGLNEDEARKAVDTAINAIATTPCRNVDPNSPVLMNLNLFIDAIEIANPVTSKKSVDPSTWVKS